MEQNKCTPEEAKKAYLTGHYPYLMQAFTIACTRAVAWRFALDSSPCGHIQLYNYAQRYDEEHPRSEGDRDFFYVTVEGAIGYCPVGLEYDVRWLFFPMEPGAEREALVKKTLAEFEDAMAREQEEDRAREAAELAEIRAWAAKKYTKE